MSIPFIDLNAQRAQLKDDINHRIQVVMDHSQFIMGPEVSQLEEALCAYVGCEHTITTSSGTDALLAVLMAWNVGRGDAVFLPSFTFPATAEAVALIGATPVFVDVEGDTCAMKPSSLVTQIAKVKASTSFQPCVIIAVDLYGLPADYAAIRQISQREGLLLVADAAQSIGGTQNGRMVGTLADATIGSFFPAKPLGCYGDGGAIFTNDYKLAETLKSIRAHGKGDSKYDIVRIGLNARLDTIQAAVLLSKLMIFEEEIDSRERLACAYDSCLGNIVRLPGRRAGSTSAWAQYTIQFERRDALASALKEDGIPTAVYYPRPMHMQPAYKDFGEGKGSLPTAEQLSCDVLSLPMHPYLADDEVERICNSIRSYLSS
ncbi:DegT/DnrJ/EryC1/StrS family aminotransferase [bacterium]|nr:DegT/DnrJ/EryC1/StrS family aminotransferase [bacterium]